MLHTFWIGVLVYTLGLRTSSTVCVCCADKWYTNKTRLIKAEAASYGLGSGDELMMLMGGKCLSAGTWNKVRAPKQKLTVSRALLDGRWMK